MASRGSSRIPATGIPTGEAAEAALGELDGGHALLFASGLAAAAAALLGLLRQGQTVAIAADAYYGVGVLISDLERWGLASTSSSTRPPRRLPAPIWSGSRRRRTRS